MGAAAANALGPGVGKLVGGQQHWGRDEQMKIIIYNDNKITANSDYKTIKIFQKDSNAFYCSHNNI